jgi:hypothetical protein
MDKPQTLVNRHIVFIKNFRAFMKNLYGVERVTLRILLITF